MPWSPPTLVAPFIWDHAFLVRLELEILPSYLPLCRWFGGKGRVLRASRISHQVELGIPLAQLLVITVSFETDAPESYNLILGVAANTPDTSSADSLVAILEDGRVLCDGLHIEELRQ